VRVLDNLDPQCHPTGEPRFLDREAELVRGDLCDPEAVRRALQDVDVVYHLGGMVGNGQSMYQLRRYIGANAGGAATLLEAILPRRDRIRRLVVASSMVVYGDGAYACSEHGVLSTAIRPKVRLDRREWEPVCPSCGREAEPIAITEDQPLRPRSTYGISK